MKKIFISLIFFCSVLLIFFTMLRSNGSYNQKLLLINFLFEEEIVKKVEDKIATGQISKLYNLRDLNYPDKEEKLSFSKINLKKLNLGKESNENYLMFEKPQTQKFFIEQNNDELYFLDSKLNLKKIKISEILNNQFKNYEVIENDLNIFDLNRVLGFLISNDKVYVSLSRGDNKKCNFFEIYESEKINLNKLKFNLFFKSEKCISWNFAGKMINYTFKEKNGILFSTSAISDDKKLAQDKDSIFGKIIFKAFDGEMNEIFSLGHRNPQGLIEYKNNIIATEHGPKGGDEINLISYKNNYGWPESSYGNLYDDEKLKLKRNEILNLDLYYKKNHKKFGFVEPIFSFVPSIGINDIILISKNFSLMWENNFFITSLNAGSLFRVKFNENLDKIIFSEKIFIGERIRDIEYLKEQNLFLLALENTGSLGVIYKELSLN